MQTSPPVPVTAATSSPAAVAGAAVPAGGRDGEALIRRTRAQTRVRYELLRNLVRKDLKVKYKGSSLGFAWSLANPLLLLGVYYVVFQVILPGRIPAFA